MDVLRQLYDWSDDTERPAMIKSASCLVFVWVCHQNHVGIIEQLHTWATKKEWSRMMKAEDYDGVRTAVKKGNLQIMVLLYSWATEKERCFIKRLLARRNLK